MERGRRRALTQAIAALNEIDLSDADTDDHDSKSEHSEAENLEEIHERQQDEAAAVVAASGRGRGRVDEVQLRRYGEDAAAVQILNQVHGKTRMEWNGALIHLFKVEGGRRMFSANKAVLGRRCRKAP